VGDVQRSIRVGCDFCDAALLAYLNDTFVHTNITNSLAIKVCNCLHPEFPPLVVLNGFGTDKTKDRYCAVQQQSTDFCDMSGGASVATQVSASSDFFANRIISTSYP
jgi:hypothetical protein